MYENSFNLCSNQNDCNLNHREILIFNSQKSALNLYLLIVHLNNVLCYKMLKIQKLLAPEIMDLNVFPVSLIWTINCEITWYYFTMVLIYFNENEQ